MGSAEFSDSDLLRGLISRDERVLREFYNLFYQGTRRFVTSNNGSDDDARDIFQDALLVLYQKSRAHDFNLRCSPATFLYSVSRFLWLKELGRRKWTTGVIDTENFIDPGNDIGEINEKNERLLFFRKCLGELPEGCRKVLTLFTKGFSIAEITKIMGYGSEQYTRNKRYRCKSTLIKNIRKVFD